MNCKNCGAFLGDATHCPVCGAENKESKTFVNTEQTPVEPMPSLAPSYPMKWYKFLIYFLLFASAVINAISAFSYFTGSVYGSDASLVYRVFPEMKTYDIMMGILSLAIAALAIIARFDLAGYKRRAKIMVCALYAANAVVPIIYVVLASSVVNQNLLEPSVIGSVFGSVVMVVLNWIYFTKRDELFIN